MLQRYGALGVGAPGAHGVAQGEYLTHGSNIGQFLHRAGPQIGQPKASPDAPAWFARGSRFSAHAGGRLGGNATHLHNYEVTQALDLLAFDDFADIQQYLVNNQAALPPLLANAVNEQANSVLVAQAIDAIANPLLPVNDGYYVAHDLVRNEAEIILFATGVAALQRRFVTTMDAVLRPISEDEPVGSAGDVHHGPRTKRILTGYGGQPVHEAVVGTLEFQTISDKGGGGRPRSFSG